jgi:hypothetical protein
MSLRISQFLNPMQSPKWNIDSVVFRGRREIERE